MALTKSPVNNVNGQTTSTTTTATDISDAYEAEAYVQIVQVGAATTAATVQIEVSPDDTNWYDEGGLLTAGTAAGTYEWAPIPLPRTGQGVRVTFTQQSGGTSSTLRVDIGKVTGI